VKDFNATQDFWTSHSATLHHLLSPTSPFPISLLLTEQINVTGSRIVFLRYPGQISVRLSANLNWDFRWFPQSLQTNPRTLPSKMLRIPIGIHHLPFLPSLMRTTRPTNLIIVYVLNLLFTVFRKSNETFKMFPITSAVGITLVNNLRISYNNL
jgi:hypothetical protein